MVPPQQRLLLHPGVAAEALGDIRGSELKQLRESTITRRCDVPAAIRLVQAREAGRSEDQQEETGEGNSAAQIARKLNNMTADDKNAQIGAAVSEYQSAKIDVAHIEQKIETVGLSRSRKHHG